MKWYGVLHASGLCEVKPFFKGTQFPKKAREVFGPFEASSYTQAKLKLRAISDAVGFLISPDGILQN